MTQVPDSSECPVVHFSWNQKDGPALARHQLLDSLRNAAPRSKVDEGIGFTLISRYEDSLSIAQNPAGFPQLRRMLDTGEPQPFLLIPEQLNGQEHAKW